MFFLKEKENFINFTKQYENIANKNQITKKKNVKMSFKNHQKS